MEKFIDCYMKWMEEGRLPYNGLCVSLPYDLSSSATFELINPDFMEKIKNQAEGGDFMFWGVTDRSKQTNKELTPLRETILLLCACINEEY